MPAKSENQRLPLQVREEQAIDRRAPRAKMELELWPGSFICPGTTVVMPCRRSVASLHGHVIPRYKAVSPPTHTLARSLSSLPRIASIGLCNNAFSQSLSLGAAGDVAF